MNSGLQTILSELKKVDQSNCNSVYIPSCDRNVMFKPLTMKHQKLIIKSALDPTATNIDYNVTVNNILAEISTDYELLVSDRVPALIALRASNVDKAIKVTQDDKSHEINLNKLISKYDKIQADNTIEYEKTVTSGDLTVKLQVPTLATDTKFFTECKKKIKTSNTTSDVSENIGEMYMYEIAKFITSIHYSTTTEATTGKLMSSVFFNQISVSDCIGVVEALPMSVNKSIGEYITSVRECESKYSTTDDDVDVPTDASLFALD